MKKNKRIIVALLAIVLTLSIGYALFSQTINITGTATASGSFQITSDCTIGLPSAIDQKLTNISVNDQKGTTNNVCTVGNDYNVTFSSNLLYPGAVQYFTIKMTNTGSEDAYLYLDDANEPAYEATNVTLCYDGATGIDANNTPNGVIDTSTECSNVAGQSDPYGIIGALLLFNIDENNFVFEKTDHSLYILEDDGISHFVVGDGDGLVLKPQESMYAVFEAKVDNRLDSNYYITTNMTVVFRFKQIRL